MLHLPPNQTNSPNVFFERLYAYEVSYRALFNPEKQEKQRLMLTSKIQ